MLKKFQQHHQENSKYVADRLRIKLIQNALDEIVKRVKAIPDSEILECEGIDIHMEVF
jgi:hypothetical protein